MILSEDTDLSTSKVMEWIDAYGGQSLRVDRNTQIYFHELEIFNTHPPYYILEIEGVKYHSNEFKSYWYRRGRLNFSNNHPTLNGFNDTIKSDIETHLIDEQEVLIQAIHAINENKLSISKIGNASMNKLTVLMGAKKIDIDIPRTHVITSRRKLSEILGNGERFITKGISEGLLIDSKNEGQFESFLSYTENVDLDADLNFFPSLIQEKLDKAYELRIFYLGETFYSMAIFSQKDSKTETDFRKYNNKKPNRKTPFKLPVEISSKLKKLMHSLNLNSGSIDMVVTKDGRYVFLEVNPVGQFGMVSAPCNFKLEKEIAKHLLSK